LKVFFTDNDLEACFYEIVPNEHVKLADDQFKIPTWTENGD